MICECSDPLCKKHTGKSECKLRAKQCVVRVDMEDYTGTLMCNACAEDALESGVFRTDVGLFIKATRRRHGKRK